MMNRLLLKITGAVLEAAGFNVLTAKDGLEALAICRQQGGHIHLALLGLLHAWNELGPN